MGKITDLWELCVFVWVSAGVCVCLCTLCTIVYPPRTVWGSVLRAHGCICVYICLCVCVCLCVCGCTPWTLKGGRQSESTMNPGNPPQLDSERSPVKGVWGGGGSDTRKEEQRKEELESKVMSTPERRLSGWSLHLVKHAPPIKLNSCTHDLNCYCTSCSKLHLRMFQACLFDLGELKQGGIIHSCTALVFKQQEIMVLWHIHTQCLDHATQYSENPLFLVWLEACIWKYECPYVCKTLAFGHMCSCVCLYEHMLHSCALDHGKQTLLPTCITLWHLQYRNSGWHF